MSSSPGLAPRPHDEGGAVTSCGVGRALEAVRGAPGIVPGLRLLDGLAAAAADDDGSALTALGRAVAEPADQLTAIAAVHALGMLPASAGHPALVELLRSGPEHLREHAAWALGSWSVTPDAVDPLVAMVAVGGFGAMVAQRTLERWGRAEQDVVGVALAAALAVDDPPPMRARLVETLGLVPGRPTTQLLLGHAVDDREDASVRAAAVAGLGDRRGDGDPEVAGVLADLATGEDPLSDVARTALHDLRARCASAGGRPAHPRSVESPPHADERPDPWVRRETSSAASGGLTVVQLFLHADIDADLSHAGRGDNGGIATLLVQLGDALLAQDGVSRVVTVSRGGPGDGSTGLEHLRDPGHHYACVPLWGTPPHQAQAWPLRVAARRGIRRILRAAGPVDVLHLRMADVGSMAAAEAARELGVPVVFTLAPDPHALLAAREAAGTLTRAGFGTADLAEHLVLRDQLVRGFADAAAHLVLFPRPEIDRDLRDLLGVDLTHPAVRASVVAEGVDLGAIDRARAAVAGAGRPDAVSPPH
ncbi:MAG TPA: HEAT repeat domain-containing protein, partial [Ornithinibacter sp.]|nr:HEAT repeat domain-containing protein [Ornithinibacter sp.]